MRRLAMVAAVALALVGCGSTHKASGPYRPQMYFFPGGFWVKAPGHISHYWPELSSRTPQLVSPTRLAILAVGGRHCQSIPDSVEALGRHVIRIHLTLAKVDGRKFVVPWSWARCTTTLEAGYTPVLVAIDPKQVDVHSPLKILFFEDGMKKPAVRRVAPLSA